MNVVNVKISAAGSGDGIEGIVATRAHPASSFWFKADRGNKNLLPPVRGGIRGALAGARPTAKTIMVEHVQQPHLRRLAQALIAAVALLPALRAQVEEEPPVKPVMEVDETTDTIAFSMNESNGMPLIEFVKWAQEVTGKRFTYTATELANGSSQGIAGRKGRAIFQPSRAQQAAEAELCTKP